MRRKPTNWTIEISLPGATTAELLGKQSVRATFKLSAKAIDAISIVSAHLGIKQKSLFDQLMDDLESLQMIANELPDNHPPRRGRIQKTFVLSRKTLACLDLVAREYNTPRDALVEYSIQRLMPIILREKERHKKRKQILEDMSAFLQEGHDLAQRSRELLGDDDPVVERIRAAIRNCETARTSVQQFVQKGELIETFE